MAKGFFVWSACRRLTADSVKVESQKIYYVDILSLDLGMVRSPLGGSVCPLLSGHGASGVVGGRGVQPGALTEDVSASLVIRMFQ